MPEIAKLGPLFKSSDKPSDLTESETEYVVQCVKHTFAEHVVFQVSLLSVLCLHKCTGIWVHAVYGIWYMVYGYMHITCTCVCGRLYGICTVHAVCAVKWLLALYVHVRTRFNVISNCASILGVPIKLISSTINRIVFVLFPTLSLHTYVLCVYHV